MDVEVVDIKSWMMHAEVAENFITSNNRVILIGDAAHRFPPAGGFGMNTGIQDAHNVAWKIDAVLQNIASPMILHTYELERRPIALSNTTLSVENFKAAMSVPTALGLDPTIANSVHQIINSGIGSVMPSELQKVILEGIFSIGRAQLSPYILNETNFLGSLRLKRLRSIFDEGKSLQLHFPSADLGFRYLEGALVTDTRGDPINKSYSKEYVPSAEPGSRLPHMHVRALGTSMSKEMLSTLDLISGDKLEFLLIIAPEEESYELARVIWMVAEEYKLPVKVCVIWPQGSSASNVNGSAAKLLPWTNYIDVEEVKISSMSWFDICQMTPKGSLLVRPDDHVAWKVESNALEDIVQETRSAFSLILGTQIP